MYTDRIRFSKIKQQWEIAKMKLAYIEAEKSIVQDPRLTGWQENTHVSTPQSEWEILMDGIHTPVSSLKDSKSTERALIRAQMHELEETARKLLAEEKYELMQEAQEIYEKLKQQLKNLK